MSVSEHLYHSFFNLVDELQLGKGGQSAQAVARWRPETAVKEE